MGYAPLQEKRPTAVAKSVRAHPEGAGNGRLTKMIETTGDCGAAIGPCKKEGEATIGTSRDMLLAHERGHVWMSALLAQRANEHLAAGMAPKKARDLAFAHETRISKEYEADTGIGCETQYAWDRAQARIAVDKAWPAPPTKT